MKNIYSIALLVILAGCSSKLSRKSVVRNAATQTDLMITELEQAKLAGNNLVSPRTLENGKLKLVASKDWTSGFFPGELWYLYELSQDDKWKELARKYTVPVEQEKLNGVTHDMGFKIYCSVGNGYRLTGDAHYKEVLIEAAKTLSTRFNPKVGLIRSWDHHSGQWAYPVIIDNMLNLELLFEASRLTADSSFYKIAVSHADKTIKNHFRADFSTFHVVSYNPESGEVEKRQTHQGYSDASAWARGQAWALYGYTMCYRETKNPAYLRQAEAVAGFIFSNKHLPKDLVPYWDFDAPGIPDEPRDVSAAAVIASALYELSAYALPGNQYQAKADTIMGNLARNYTSAKGENKGFILGHSTGSKPMDSEVDVPLVYADYYYLEALVRKKNLQK